MIDTFSYIPKGTCSKKIKIEIKNDVISSVDFMGGCPGNLLGITRLIKGMEVNEVLDKFSGLKCGTRNTSCPDQLAKALFEYVNKNRN